VNEGSNNVTIIDGATNLVTATIAVGTSPHDTCYDTTTAQVYVTNTGSNTVTEIS